MELVAPIINIKTLVPQIVLLVSATMLLLLPVFIRSIKREILAALAIIGFSGSFILLINLWNQNASGFNDLLRLDNFAIAFHFTFLLGGALAVLTSLNHVEREYLSYGEYYALMQFAVIGMMIMTSTTNLLVIFLGLEVLSIALYVLAGIRKMRVDSIEASLKYFLLGAFATGFLLYGIALIYGATNSLDLLLVRKFVFTDGLNDLLLIAGAFLLLVGFAFKAAFVPFHMWTPDVYQGAPTPVTAFMSTGTKGAALAVLLRVVLVGIPMVSFDWNTVLSVIAILTMCIGNLVAIAQNNIKRMLAYSSIAHAGYLLVAIVAGNELGQTSVIYYLFVYTFMNLGAFGVVSYLGNSNKEEHLNLEDYRGLGYRYPFAGLAMSVFMFSLAGIPPTGGFVGKFYIFSAAVEAGYIGLVVVAVLNSVISVYYYLRVVINMYMREPERDVAVATANPGLIFAIIIAALGIIHLGIMPRSLYDILTQSVIALY